MMKHTKSERNQSLSSNVHIPKGMVLNRGPTCAWLSLTRWHKLSGIKGCALLWHWPAKESESKDNRGRKRSGDLKATMWRGTRGGDGMEATEG